MGSASPIEELKLVPLEEAQTLERLDEAKFALKVPASWRPPVSINRHAEEVGKATAVWIAAIGCSAWQVRRVLDFQASHYVGIPFPLLDYEKTLWLSKYLSLWLLWDDVEIESRKNHWRIEARHVLEKTPPKDASQYDLAWLELLIEAAQTMSAGWLEVLTKAMFSWNDAALEEARLGELYRQDGSMPRFAVSLRNRTHTIGMYGTACLIEYALGAELPVDFHEHSIVRRMKTLSSMIVGLGNELFSLAKDQANGQINVIAVLAAKVAVPLLDAVAGMIRLHNATVLEYDHLEQQLPRWGAAWDPLIKEWVQNLRYCSLGFTVWESQAPRYNKQKLVVGGRVLEPTFVYI